MSKLERLANAGAMVAEGIEKARGMIDELRGAKAQNLEEGQRIVPPPPHIPESDKASLDVWGFEDTKFTISPTGNVVVTGNRYDIAGQELPNLLPWVKDTMGIAIDVREEDAGQYPTKIPRAKRNKGFQTAIEAFLDGDQYTDDGQLRMRHGHGHTQSEMYNIKYGSLERIPDLVVYPKSEEEVERLVKLAIEHDVSLVPYGGGTNVTEALACKKSEKRCIVSVDMSRMNRILWIDPVNRMACIEAGAVGRHITEQLADYGFTMGHEPDSIEFSTMGGWVATNASGMKKNKYGNIEDLLLDVTVVTTQGKLERKILAPRESTGADPRQWVLGSEGNIGIITKAVVKIFTLPEVRKYGSVLFPTFSAGTKFMYELSQQATYPASVRLVDNVQFKFSMALKPASEGLKAAKSRLEKLLVTKLKGFDPDQMVAATLVFEGTKEEVEAQEKQLYAIATKHGGMKAGSSNGEKGYQLTFGIAYIRDFVMRHRIIAESFETSVPWSKAEALCENVKGRVWEQHKKLGLPGKPFVTCRLTQIYPTGVAIYFYFAYYSEGVENPSEVYAQIEHEARAEILRSGGSLSHHHGVGKIRQSFLPEIMSNASLQWNKAAKEAIDPQNVFGTGNQLVLQDDFDSFVQPSP